MMLRRYLPAILWSLTTWMVAPSMDLVREAVFARFRAGQVVRVISVVLIVTMLAVLSAALWRLVRARADVASARARRWRWWGFVLVLALLWVQLQGFRLGIPSSDVLERIHIAQYALLAILL